MGAGTAAYGFNSSAESWQTAKIRVHPAAKPRLVTAGVLSSRGFTMKQLCGLVIVAMTSAILVAGSSCWLPARKEEKPEYTFCHANSECEAPKVCNKEIGYWRPPYVPPDAGVCIEPAVATCPEGYQLSGGYNPRTGWNTSFCATGPTYCHSDQECVSPFKCDKHTDTVIPLSAGKGAGICGPTN
jgi:hypothetical protein